MAFVLPELNYSYDALEPHLDAKTMEIHYTLHHQTYVNKANDALLGTPYDDASDEWLLKNIHTLPTNVQAAVRDHVGGHHNHSLFWTVMSAHGGHLNIGPLADEIQHAFGSFEAFRELFVKAALSRFGSGWAWLVIDTNGKLSVTSTANQDSPLMQQLTPILGLDVWEHAYYLKYQNRRPEYINAFFNVIDWQEVERRYLAVM
ncbi:Manganese superoxide dismutase [Pseudoalteromonas luteoviolacea B = ATCC 29581]|nr:Manganese superoxide dismutase [Pseudoalteromonas luteoviolacea B = ATCC 29581]